MPRPAAPRSADRRLDAVLFDAGGVLVLPDPTVLIPLLTPLGGSSDLADHRRAHYAAMAAKSRVAAPEGEWSEYDAAYVTAVGVACVDRDHAAEVLGRTRSHHLWRWPIPESVQALRTLAARRIPMGVVSNASGQIEAELARSGICQVGPGDGVDVRVVVDSHVVGVAKPDPRIFETALSAFDSVELDRIGYVGDSVTMDVAAARAAGLTPILLDPYDDHTGADFSRIGSLADLAMWC